MSEQFVILGAGVSGLSCARELSRAGKKVVLLNRGRSAGGRCSTWRTEDGHRFDYGTPFLHGEDPEFTDLFDEVGGTFLDGWPLRVTGNGSPCQANAFSWRGRRGVYTEGISALPKHLAQGLDIRNRQNVTGLAISGESIRIELEDGSSLDASNVVLAMAAQQAAKLLAPIEDRSNDIRAIRHILGGVSAVPCLALMATYPESVPLPNWDLMLPINSSVLQLITNESSKQRSVPGLGLVFQARPRWSAARLEVSPDVWMNDLLEHSRQYLGDWCTTPTWSRAHRWSYARTDLGNELGTPFLTTLGTARLGIIGESFARGVGLQGAYISGIQLAKRLLEIES